MLNFKLAVTVVIGLTNIEINIPVRHPAVSCMGYNTQLSWYFNV
jgi:hypothetical protein